MESLIGGNFEETVQHVGTLFKHIFQIDQQPDIAETSFGAHGFAADSAPAGGTGTPEHPVSAPLTADQMLAEKTELAQELGINPDLIQVNPDGTATIMENGKPIARIIPLDQMEPGVKNWYLHHGGEGKHHIIATLAGDRHPGAMEKELMKLGVVHKNDIIYFTDNVTDDAKGDCFRTNQLLVVNFDGPPWKCEHPVDVSKPPPPVKVEDIPIVAPGTPTHADVLCPDGTTESIYTEPNYDAALAQVKAHPDTVAWYQNDKDHLVHRVIIRDGKICDEPVKHLVNGHWEMLPNAEEDTFLRENAVYRVEPQALAPDGSYLLSAHEEMLRTMPKIGESIGISVEDWNKLMELDTPIPSELLPGSTASPDQKLEALKNFLKANGITATNSQARGLLSVIKEREVFTPDAPEGATVGEVLKNGTEREIAAARLSDANGTPRIP